MYKEKNSSVYLEPIQHKYINKVTGQKYTSVTTAISIIEPDFDADAIAEAIFHQPDNIKQERYIGMSKEQILNLWIEINNEANEYGTRVHDILERYLKADKFWFPTDEFEKKIISKYNELNIDEGLTMHPECILFSEEYQIGGMSDLIVNYDEEFFGVLDHKTNKEFRYYNPFGHQTLLPPYQHLQNCQYSIYTLQLSIYAFMYSMETGKKCRDITILHWDKELETFSKIPVIYMKDDAKKLLELHKYSMLCA